MEYIYLLSAAWFFWSFEPLQYLFDKIFTATIYAPRRTRNVFNFFHNALSCSQCVGFWLTFMITGELFTSFVVSLMSYTLELCLQRLNK